MLNVLILAYYFPPYGGGATARVHNFAKYLPRFRVMPTILTADDQVYEDTYRDAALLTEYDTQVVILRAPVLLGRMLKRAKASAIAGSGKPAARSSALLQLKKAVRALLIPDEQILWVPGALSQAMRLARAQRFQAIIATGPPFSTHLLAAMLCRLLGAPLVLDYRDLWSINQPPAKGRLRARIHHALERLTLASARLVLFTNPAAREQTCQRFTLDEAKTMIVENGYDAEALERALSAPAQPALRLRINYLGSLTAQRTPEFLLKAAMRLRERRPDLAFEIGFVGYAPQAHHELVADLGVTDWVRFYGSKSRDEALAIMGGGSDVLIVLQRQSEGGDTAIPGKIYEYLATGKPILALDEGLGPTSRFLSELGVRHVSEYADLETIEAHLENLLAEYPAHLAQAGHFSEKIRPQERQRLVETLASALYGRFA